MQLILNEKEESLIATHIMLALDKNEIYIDIHEFPLHIKYTIEALYECEEDTGARTCIDASCALLCVESDGYEDIDVICDISKIEQIVENALKNY